MKERTSPPLGAYRVHAFTCPAEAGDWRACGQTWMTGRDGQSILLAEVTAGPHDCPRAALDEAYDRAYTDTLRLILREFACF